MDRPNISLLAVACFLQLYHSKFTKCFPVIIIRAAGGVVMGRTLGCPTLTEQQQRRYRKVIRGRGPLLYFRLLDDSSNPAIKLPTHLVVLNAAANDKSRSSVSGLQKDDSPFFEKNQPKPSFSLNLPWPFRHVRNFGAHTRSSCGIARSSSEPSLFPQISSYEAIALAWELTHISLRSFVSAEGGTPCCLRSSAGVSGPASTCIRIATKRMAAITSAS